MLDASLRHMRLVLAALFVAALCGCASRVPSVRPSIAAAREPLHITVVYPDTADPIQAQDSSFVFGSVGRGRGDVALSVNGFPVRVAPSGSWLAWIPLPSDSLAHFQIVARAGTGGGGGTGGTGAPGAPSSRRPRSSRALRSCTGRRRA